MNSEDMASLAVELTKSIGGDLVKVVDSNEKAAVIRYIKPSASNASRCVLSIVERSEHGARVVATNDQIVACPLASNAKEVDVATELSMADGTINLAGESKSGRSEFVLKRKADGTWLVRNISFTRPEEDEETGEMAVVNEAAAYSDEGKKVPVSDYSFDRVEGDLVKHTIE